MNFQHTILGNDDSCIDENHDTDSNEAEDTTDNKEVDQLSKENADVAVELKVDDDSKSVKVNLNSIPFVSYAPKASKPSTSSGMEQYVLLFFECILLKNWNQKIVRLLNDLHCVINSGSLTIL
jgi:activating signal cointegrator complex subunit 1